MKRKSESGTTCWETEPGFWSRVDAKHWSSYARCHSSLPPAIKSNKSAALEVGASTPAKESWKSLWRCSSWELAWSSYPAVGCPPLPALQTQAPCHCRCTSCSFQRVCKHRDGKQEVVFEQGGTKCFILCFPFVMLLERIGFLVFVSQFLMLLMMSWFPMLCTKAPAHDLGPSAHHLENYIIPVRSYFAIINQIIHNNSSMDHH